MGQATRPPGGRADAGVGAAAKDEEGDALSRRKLPSFAGTVLLAAWAPACPRSPKRRPSRPATPVAQHGRQRARGTQDRQSTHLLDARLGVRCGCTGAGRRRRPTGSASSYDRGGPLQVTTRTVRGRHGRAGGRQGRVPRPGRTTWTRRPARPSTWSPRRPHAISSRRSTRFARARTRACCCRPSAIRCSRRCCSPACSGCCSVATAGRRVVRTAVVQRRFPKQLPDWAGQVVGEAAVAGLFTVPLKLVALLLGVLFTYEWAGFVLGAISLHASLGRGAARQSAADAGATSAKPSSRRFRDCCSSR